MFLISYKRKAYCSFRGRKVFQEIKFRNAVDVVFNNTMQHLRASSLALFFFFFRNFSIKILELNQEVT